MGETSEELLVSYRVVSWSTGNVGRHAIAGIHAHPDLDLIGVWVSSPVKDGRDAGELAGLGRELGVRATADTESLLALRPDCIVHSAMADNRIFEALEDLQRFLRAGINVVSSGPVFLQYPDGVVPDEIVAPVRQAALDGGSSLWVNGIDPGFANDWLPLVLTGMSERIDEIRCMEILNYATYDQPMVLFDLMGFGRPLDETPPLLQPGTLTTAFGSVVRQLAAGLGVELDGVEQVYERVPAPGAFEIASGTIAGGTAAALRFEVRGMRRGRALVVLEHVTRLRDDLAPEWPQPPGHGGYRVVITGEPNYTVDLQLLGSDGDHNTAGLKATAMRLVNAVPAVVASPPGLLTALDLPLVTGRGLVV
jgi:4-hydroxy-tetrahydrodipicolinate reductase